MKRKFIFLLFILGLGALVILAVRLLSGRAPKQGVLKVTSTPGASIFLDNKHMGRTPFEDKVAAGEYTVKIVPESTVDSLASWQGKVTVAPNTLTYINRELSESELTSSGEVLWLEKISSKTAEIDVITNPDGASVLLDDALKGITPMTLTDILPSSNDPKEDTNHTLTVTSPGFITKTLKVKTTPGYKVKIAIQLALNPGSQPTEPTPTISEVSPSPSVSPTSSISPKTTPTPMLSPTKAATPSATPKVTPTDPAKPFIKIKDTPTGYLRVREEPSTGSKELGRVNPGEKYTIADSKEVSGVTWYQIKYDGTNLGWVSGQYVEKVE